MRISAIVLNWKDNARTVRCFSALVDSEWIEHIFVVDNESSGELRPLLNETSPSSSSRWSLVEEASNLGFAGGVNGALQMSLDRGFQAALVINNDAFIDSDSIRLLVDALELDPGLGLVGPRVLHPDGAEESAGGYLIPGLGIASHKPVGKRPLDFITWACVLVRSDALDEVGLLDEGFFMYWEDIDFSYRLQAAGWRVEICREASVTHAVSTNRRSHPIAIKAYHTWSAITFSRKYRGVWLVGNACWLVLSTAANLARFRGSSLRGLYLGFRLALEASSPASGSPLRQSEFGLNRQ